MSSRRSTKRSRQYPAVLQQLEEQKQQQQQQHDDSDSESSEDLRDTKRHKIVVPETQVIEVSDHELEETQDVDMDEHDDDEDDDEVQASNDEDDADAEVQLGDVIASTAVPDSIPTETEAEAETGTGTEPHANGHGDVFVLPDAQPHIDAGGAGGETPTAKHDDVVRYAKPSKNDVAYAFHLHPLHYSRFDPTSARLKMPGAKASTETTAKSDNGDHGDEDGDADGDRKTSGTAADSGADNDALLPSIVFGPAETPIDVILTEQGRCSYDTDIIRGNYVDLANPHRQPGKFDVSDPKKMRIAVPLMYTTDSAFIQWLDKVRETIERRIVDERDPAMRHMTDEVFEEEEEDVREDNKDNAMDETEVMAKIMRKYLKKARKKLSLGAFVVKEDKKFGRGARITPGMSAAGTLTANAKQYIARQYGEVPRWPYPLQKELYEKGVTYLASTLTVTGSKPAPAAAKQPQLMNIPLSVKAEKARFIHGGRNVATQVQLRLVKHPKQDGYVISYRLKAVHICGTEFNGESGSGALGGEYGDTSCGLQVQEFDASFFQ